jgi:hypothetical protein
MLYTTYSTYLMRNAMLLILEDNPAKLLSLLERLSEKLIGQRVVIVDNVDDAEAVCRMMPTEELELWLDHELRGSRTGSDFLEFVLTERRCWLKQVMITTASNNARTVMRALCTSNGITHATWAVPFG